MPESTLDGLDVGRGRKWVKQHRVDSSLTMRTLRPQHRKTRISLWLRYRNEEHLTTHALETRPKLFNGNDAWVGMRGKACEERASQSESWRFKYHGISRDTLDIFNRLGYFERLDRRRSSYRQFCVEQTADFVEKAIDMLTPVPVS